MTWKDAQTLVILFLCTGLAYFYGSMLGLENQLAKTEAQYRTQQVCGDAHGETNGKSEQACGDIQDKYNTKFMCDSLPPNTHCWTEVL